MTVRSRINQGLPAEGSRQIHHHGVDLGRVVLRKNHPLLPGTETKRDGDRQKDIPIVQCHLTYFADVFAAMLQKKTFFVKTV